MSSSKNAGAALSVFLQMVWLGRYPLLLLVAGFGVVVLGDDWLWRSAITATTAGFVFGALMYEEEHNFGFSVLAGVAVGIICTILTIFLGAWAALLLVTLAALFGQTLTYDALHDRSPETMNTFLAPHFATTVLVALALSFSLALSGEHAQRIAYGGVALLCNLYAAWTYHVMTSPNWEISD